MDNTRLKKVEQLFQEELSEAFRLEARDNFLGVLISASEVRVTPDLSLARVWVSVFPDNKQKEVFEYLNENLPKFRNYLAQHSAKRMRVVPNLSLMLDQSQQRAQAVEKALKGKGENPLLD